MDNLLAKTREICQMLEIKPARSKGQNFLINENIYDDIVRAADLKSDDLVLEIGPGLGFLTMKLAKLVKKVVAVELDDQLADYLQTGIKSVDISNVEIINSDILKFNLAKLNGQKYKVVANLPYNITSIFLRQFLSGENKPEALVLMLQKEVAKRICAKPGQMSLLAVSVQFYAEPKIISYVSKNCFWPAPKVDSAIIKITPFGAAQGKKQISRDLFFEVVKAGFSQPRKQLVNNLTTLKSLNGVKLTKEQTSKWLLKNNLEPSQRAETLAVSDWINLSKNFNE